MIRDDILVTTEAFHNCISEGEPAVVERLIELGYSPLHAEILLVFVPLGLNGKLIASGCCHPRRRTIQVSDTHRGTSKN